MFGTWILEESLVRWKSIDCFTFRFLSLLPEGLVKRFLCSFEKTWRATHPVPTGCGIFQKNIELAPGQVEDVRERAFKYRTQA